MSTIMIELYEGFSNELKVYHLYAKDDNTAKTAYSLLVEQGIDCALVDDKGKQLLP